MVNFGLGGNSVSAIPMAQMLMNPATCLLSPQASYRIIHIPTPTPRRFTLHSHYDAASSPILHKTSEEYSSSVGSPTLHLSRWNPHINLIASAVAVSATCLFLSAIPALLAFKRAAESLEKLMDVTREELPDTMSAIRLSGMEISDLTMELSDLGQGITQGVKNSTQAVRVAEQRLRQFSTKDPSASLQRITSPKTEVEGPALARKARSMREGIVKGRAIFQLFSTLTGFSRMLLNYFAKKRAKQ